MITYRIHPQSLLVIILAFTAVARGAAQGRAPANACDPTTSTSLAFGHTGGTLRPSSVRIAPNGSMSRMPDSTPAGSITPAAVSALARLAWAKEFVALPEAPTRPTRNPDVTRDFIEVTSACGRKHVEYPSGEGARIFRELYDLLAAVTPH
jgi:hypothetical protein